MRGGNGGPCCHCGVTSSPCWRRGPPDKPTLCNACGARYLARNKQAASLQGWMPGCRGGQHALRYTAAAQQVRLAFQQHPSGQAASEPTRHVGYSKRAWQHVQADSSTSKDTTEESAAEYSSKRARLVSCRVFEFDPHTASALRLLKTFETADGVVLTVIRRPRKQAKPQPCAVM